MFCITYQRRPECRVVINQDAIVNLICTLFGRYAAECIVVYVCGFEWNRVTALPVEKENVSTTQRTALQRMAEERVCFESPNQIRASDIQMD